MECRHLHLGAFSEVNKVHVSAELENVAAGNSRVYPIYCAACLEWRGCGNGMGTGLERGWERGRAHPFETTGGGGISRKGVPVPAPHDPVPTPFPQPLHSRQASAWNNFWTYSHTQARRKQFWIWGGGGGKDLKGLTIFFFFL